MIPRNNIDIARHGIKRGKREKETNSFASRNQRRTTSSPRFPSPRLRLRAHPEHKEAFSRPSWRRAGGGTRTPRRATARAVKGGAKAANQYTRAKCCQRRGRTYLDLGPEVRGKEAVGGGDGSVRRLNEVAHAVFARGGMSRSESAQPLFTGGRKGSLARTHVEVLPRDWV